MTRILILSLVGILLLIESCSSHKSTSSHPEPFFVGWNEDTINSYQITLLENKNFFYAIVKKENDIKKASGFSGTYKFSSDSIILTYKSNLEPAELARYIIKEASGMYLIQYFKDGEKRMFLRKQKTNHRF